MKHATGNLMDLIDTPNNMVFITTNAIVKRNGALVMGAGIAKQVRDTYPGIDKVFGDMIKANGTKEYGILYDEAMDLGIFQVKHHYADNANLALISQSALMLAKLAAQHPNMDFHLNYPGIGNGKLSIARVEPLLQLLPDNVTVWTFK